MSSSTSLTLAVAILAFLTRGAMAQSAMPEDYSTVRYVHATFGCIVMVVLFPAGAALIRIGAFPGVVWYHTALQLFAYTMFVVNVGTGIWMATTTQQWQFAHPVLGTILFVLFTLQPVLGLIHHFVWRKKHKRTVWGHSHVLLGRSLILIGIINGGLGLELSANSSSAEYIAYGVVGGAVWLAYLAVMTVSETQRSARVEAGALILPPDEALTKTESS